MRSCVGRKCLCCEACPGCPVFKKVVSETGFEVYRYVECVRNVCSDKKILKAYCFVFNNKQDFLINSNEVSIDIETSQISCQHCKNIFKQISNILQGTSVNKNAIIFICDNCVSKEIKYDKKCKFCKEIYEKFISSSILLKSKTKSNGAKWISEIQRLLSNNRKIDKGHEEEYLQSSLHIFTTNNSKQDILRNVSEEIIIQGKQSFKYVFPKIDMEHRDLIKYTSSTELVKDVQKKTELKTNTERGKLELNETTKINKRKHTSPSRVVIDKENNYIRNIKSDSTTGETINKHNRRLKGGRDINELTSTIPKLVESYPGDKNVMAKFTNLTVNGDKLKNAEKREKNSNDEKESKNKIREKARYISRHLKDVRDSGDDDFVDRTEHSVKTQNTQEKLKALLKRRKNVQESSKTVLNDTDKKGKLKSKNSKESKRISSKEFLGYTKQSERETNGKSFASELLKRNKITKENSKTYIDNSDKKGKLKTSKESQLVGNTKQSERKTSGKFFASELIKRRKNTKEISKTYLNDSDKKSKLKSKISKEFQLVGNTKQSQRKTSGKSLTLEGLNLHRVTVQKASIDDLQLNVKHSTSPEKRKKPTQLSDLNISPIIIREHQTHKSRKSLSCVICLDSELEIDIDYVEVQKDRLNEFSEVIIGQKISKHKAHFNNETNKKAVDPMFFESSLKEFKTNLLPKEKNGNNSLITEHISNGQESPKGAVRYALSNRSFIEKGWTMLPTEKIVRKLNVYHMKPSHPEFDWFEHNKTKKVIYYDTGEMLAEFDEDGRGRWFYKNGRLALDYFNAKEMNAGQRYVVYSNGEPDERRRVRPITVLATFDYLGNGVVFNHTGKIRLKYNQTEGVIMDREIGPISHWKWHELNDPPVLQKVMTDTQLAVKDPDILKLGGTEGDTPQRDNEEMLAIEFDNFIKEKSKKLTQKFKPFQITTKALKINENFSLRVLDQATVYLLFRDGTTNLKLNLGMILDHQEIVDTDTAEVGEVATNMERFPARTDSLAMLQSIVAHAQHVEKLRIERERRFRFTANNSSIDCIHTEALSRPLQPPINSVAEIECFCKLRKSSIFNIDSDTNLI